MLQESIITLSKKYISCVDDIYTLMLKVFGLNSKDDMILFRGKNGQGNFYLEGDNHYTFHGRGCWFCNDKIKIDWDFGYGHRWCGLDPWKMYNYLVDNNIENPFDNGHQVKELFTQLVAEGKMEIKYGLYYLKEKSQSRKK